MKTAIRHPFLLPALLAGLGLPPAGRVTAQNFTAGPVTHIAAGGYHSLFTRSDGTLFCMGENVYGQLGLGPLVGSVGVPQPVTNGVGQVAGGLRHSVFVVGRGLWTMGWNTYGQLGDGTTVNHYFPEQIASVGSQFRYNALSAGGVHTLYGTISSLTGVGGLSAMGDNEYGQLGDGTVTERLTPEGILSYGATNPKVTAVAAGGDHTLFLKSDGSLWAMGDNEEGQLGDGTTTSRSSPEQIVASNVAAVAAGNQHSLFIKSDGSLWGMGYNFNGQLGDGSTINRSNPVQIVASNVVAVGAGGGHTLFVLSDGSLWGMGDDHLGQLGLRLSGPLGNQFVQTPVQIAASNVVAVAAGSIHSLFLKSDGSLWGMGYNGFGQLGLGQYDYTDRYTPVEIVAPPPQITLIPYGPNVILAWPTNAVGFNLQSTTNLASPSAWSTVSPGPVVIGTQFAVFYPVSGPRRFYRLSLAQ
jgi:alpha-tubulin suppressor-like RCC1 family protein